MSLAAQVHASEAPSAISLTQTGLVVDAHVHFHECFTWREFLHAAATNLQRAWRQSPVKGHAMPCLMMTESAGQHAFRTLRQRVDAAACGGWSATQTDEARSLILHHPDEPAILLIAGRQVVVRERLEVLALGTDREFRDGQPIRNVLEQIHASDGIAVIPWGFGKWSFGRGRIVREIVQSKQIDCRLFVGDNSGRPRLSLTPTLFETAASNANFVLPGSDPLPFPSQTSVVGRYGFFLPGTFCARRPAREVCNALRALKHQPHILGQREQFWRFCRVQLAMQVKKHRRTGLS